MEEIIAATEESVGLTEFTTARRGFWLYGSNFQGTHEKSILHRIGASGEYEPATNKDGLIFVGAAPNSAFVDLPAGTYAMTKTKTILEASVSFEDVAA